MNNKMPQYKSFKPLRDKNGTAVWWPYGWVASLALIITALISFGTFYYLTTNLGFGSWGAAAIAFGVGFCTGLFYNMLADRFNWQQVHPMDLFWFDLPFW